MTEFERVCGVDINLSTTGLQMAYEQLVGTNHPRVVALYTGTHGVFRADEIIQRSFPRWLGCWNVAFDPSLPQDAWYVEFEGRRVGSIGA